MHWRHAVLCATALGWLGVVSGCGGDLPGQNTAGGSSEATGTSGPAAGSSGTAGETAAETGTTEEPPDPINRDVAAYPFETLSEYNFFRGDLADLVPNDGVISYTVASPLWADAAAKGRYFVLPEGTTIGFVEQGAWDFPTGSVFIKHFYFDQDRGPAEDLRVVETRLLVLQPDGGWQGYIYLWNETQTEAERTKAGGDVHIEYIDEAGDAHSQRYWVPDQNVCETCHRRDDLKVILGATTRQMNTDWAIGGEAQGDINQIDWLSANGFFSGSVPSADALPRLADPAGEGPIEARARAYLHGNCSHCHRVGGLAGGTGLRLSAWIDTPSHYGVCKSPGNVDAGSSMFAIWPGHPEKSLIPFRMASEDPETKMPELPNLLADERGVELIEDWIRQLPGESCDE